MTKRIEIDVESLKYLALMKCLGRVPGAGACESNSCVTCRARLRVADKLV